jgi:hypothetical protein
VRVSLAQTAMWIRGLGMAGEDRLEEVETIRPDEIRTFSIRSETGFGPVTHLRPAVQMSATPTFWKRPVVPLGTHPPRWPAKS